MNNRASNSQTCTCLFGGDVAPDGRPDLSGLLGGINAGPHILLLVVTDDGLSLVVVGSETLLEGFNVVITALDKVLAGDVVLHVILRGVEFLVVGTTARRVDETALDTGNKALIRDLKLNNVLEGGLTLRQHLVEGLGLGDGTRETVKNETVLAVLVVLELTLDHADHDVVTHKTTLVHDLLGLLAKLSASLDLATEHITGSKVARLALLNKVGGLSTLSSTRGADEDHAEGRRKVNNLLLLNNDLLRGIVGRILGVGETLKSGLGVISMTGVQRRSTRAVETEPGVDVVHFCCNEVNKSRVGLLFGFGVLGSN